VDPLQWFSLIGSALVVGLFGLRALLGFTRASDRLAVCTRSCEYLLATLDEKRLPDLRYDTLDVSKKLAQLQGALRSASTVAHRKLRFRRTSLEDDRTIRDALERARSSTEILPLCGVLGTAAGFLLTSSLGPGIEAVGAGMWLALVSTVLALLVTILLKWVFEGRLLPEYAHFQQLTQAIETAIDEGGTELLLNLGPEAQAANGSVGR
jgi:hypothetical protein